MKTAIITGASSGLGAEFAKSIAQSGRAERIIIIARRRERLELLARQLKEYARIDVLPLDLTEDGAVKKIEEALDGDVPELLINCAGFGKLGPVGKTCGQSGMIELNCGALTRLCEFAASVMQAGGHIINIASIAAFVPTPNLAVYGATKAYVLSFSKALSAELKDRGITVTAVCPGPVDTEFFAVAGIENSRLFDSLIHMPAGYVVSRALKASAKGRWVCTPHPFYKLYRAVSKILPDRLLIKLTRA